MEFDKENCGIRKNLSCYDCKYRDKYLPLLRIDDSFMKYVITGDLIKKYQNMTASYLWTYLISCWIKILYENLNKIKRRVCHKLMTHPLF